MTQPGGDRTGPAGGVPALTFVSDMRLLTSRFMWWDFAKVIVFSTMGMWLAVFVMSLLIDPTDLVMLPPSILLITGGILLVLFVLACLLMGNHWSYEVSVSPEGLVWSVGARERRINRVVGALNVMSGRPVNIGASLIATSQEIGGIGWESIHRINVHEGPGVISLRDSWHVVQRLYVPRESWQAVLAAVQAGVLAGQLMRDEIEVEEPVRPAPRRGMAPVVAWIAATIVLAVAASAWRWAAGEGGSDVALAAIALLLILAIVLEGPLRRMLALAALACIAWFAALVTLEALSTFDSWVTGRPTATWTLDTPQLVVTASCMGALALIALWRLLGRAWSPPAGEQG